MQDVVAKLSEAATERLSEADKLVNTGEYREAMSVYSSLASMREIAVGPLANRRLLQMRRDPELRESLAEVDAAQLYDGVERLLLGLQLDDCGWESSICDCEDCSRAREEGEADSELNEPDEVTDLDRALRLDTDWRVEVVIQLDAIRTRYDETPTGRKSEELYQALMADEALSLLVDVQRQNDVASRHWQMAELYELNGRHEQAAELYRRILDECPDSEFAARAEEALRSGR